MQQLEEILEVSKKFRNKSTGKKKSNTWAYKIKQGRGMGVRWNRP